MQASRKWRLYLFSLAASVSSASAADLCKRDEMLVFACGVRAERSASICRTSDKTSLIYRFGRPDALELEFADRTGDRSKFFYGSMESHFVRSRSLGFSRGGYTYEAVRVEREGADARYSIVVETPTGRHMLPCTQDIQDIRLDSTTDVSCDPYDTHGCLVEDAERMRLLRPITSP